MLSVPDGSKSRDLCIIPSLKGEVRNTGTVTTLPTALRYKTVLVARRSIVQGLHAITAGLLLDAHSCRFLLLSEVVRYWRSRPSTLPAQREIASRTQQPTDNCGKIFWAFQLSPPARGEALASISTKDGERMVSA